MKRILKYQLKRVSFEPQQIMLPEHSVILKVGSQKDPKVHGYFGEVPTLWILLDDSCSLEPRYFETFETEENLRDLWADKYVGTALLDNGNLVCHVFEVTKLKGLIE